MPGHFDDVPFSPGVGHASPGAKPVTDAQIKAGMQYLPGGHFGDVPFSNAAGNAPPDFHHPVGGNVTATARALANGVPLVGQVANKAEAAFAATLSPAVEPLLDMSASHDKRWDVNGPGSTWGDRYSRALSMQDGMDSQFQHDHPAVSTGSNVAGGILGTIAGARYLSPMSGLLAKAMPDAGLGLRSLAGAADGAGVGGGMGYLNGNAAWNDPGRIKAAEAGGELGGLAGFSAPGLSKLIGSAWKATAGKAVDVVRPNVTVGGASPHAGLIDAMQQAGVNVPKAAAAADPADLAQALDAHAATINPAGVTAPVGLTVPPAPPGVSVPKSAANSAYDFVYRNLARGPEGVNTPAGALGRVGTLGPHGMLADASVPLRDAARTITDARGMGGQMAKAALDQRQAGQLVNGQYVVPTSGQRIVGGLNDALGVTGSQYDARAAELLREQKAASDPAYVKAYAAPPVPISDLGDFSGSKMFSDAYDRAHAISQTEMVPQVDGSQKLEPIPSWQELNAKAAPTAGPSVRQAAEQAWALHTGEAPAPGSTPSGPSLDWRTLDLMKQGMDDMHREAVTGGIGANAQRADQSFKNAFVSKLDAINPDYTAARQAFSGPAQSMEAMEAGRNFLKDDGTGITNDLSQLSPSDQQFYRLGGAKGFSERLGAVPDTANAAARAGVATGNMMDKMQALFPDQQSWGDFHNSLQGENDMFATRQRVLGGSLTSRNEAQAADAGMNPLEMAGAVAEAHADPVSGGLHLLSQLFRAGNGQGLSEPTANAAASLLFTPGAHITPDFQAGLDAAAQRAAMANWFANSARPAGAAYAGSQLGMNNPGTSAQGPAQ